MGNTIPQGVSPAVTKTVPELEIVPRYNRFLQLLEDVMVAATFEAFAVVGEDVDRAIVVVATPIAKCFLARFGGANGWERWISSTLPVRCAR